MVHYKYCGAKEQQLEVFTGPRGSVEARPHQGLGSDRVQIMVASNQIAVGRVSLAQQRLASTISQYLQS